MRLQLSSRDSCLNEITDDCRHITGIYVVSDNNGQISCDSLETHDDELQFGLMGLLE